MESLNPLTLLQFYVDSGVDEALGDLAQDRFKVLEKLQAPSPSNVLDLPPTPVAVAATHDGLIDARALAASAKTLEELRAAIDKFQGLSIKRSATQMVFADGVAESGIMLIGEAPGEDEDRVGRPFVGVSGQLLDKMLAAIGLSRETNIYLTNILNWRPAGNRAPTDSEIALSLPFIQRHIEIVQPKLIILAGGVAAKALLETNTGITRLRGKWVDYTLPGLKTAIPLMPIFHPSYLLSSPQQKSLAWADLQAIRLKLKETT